MTGGRQNFRHDRSAYERSTLGWRCGRAAFWKRSCARGPGVDGVCGGVADCIPGRQGNSWQCRRRQGPESGPCAAGPSPDGVCGSLHPPCAPRRTLRAWRGRVTVLAVGLSLALIVLFAGGADMRSGRLSSLDPGALSMAHSHFAGDVGCNACHDAHGKGAAGWWRAFWQTGTADSQVRPLADKCTDCHGFAGRETIAHNQVFEKRGDLGRTDCLMCHTEHKGQASASSTTTQVQCQTCHTSKIHAFAVDHPAFPPSFPHDHGRSTRFDHLTHFGKYFSDPRLADRAPAGGCVGCHQVENAGRNIRPPGFDAACAGCHGEAISRREFVLFRWPEIEKSDIPVDEIIEACGADGDAVAEMRAALEAARRGEPRAAVKSPSAFSAVSADPPTAVSAFFLGAPADDPAQYGAPVQELARGMMRSGADPLAEALNRLGAAARAQSLLAGLNPEQLRRAACAWAANREYEPPGQAVLPGWRTDALELRYAKPAHADPVLRAWLETWAAASPPASAGDRERFLAARKELFSPGDGPGACLKCHTATGTADGVLAIQWKHTLREARPLSRFDHRPHVDLLGPEKTCTSCHRPMAAATPAGAVFQPLTLASCTTCHAAGRVRDDCQLCHVYHQNHALMKRMMSDAK